MKHWNFDWAYEVLLDHLKERYRHMIHNVNWGDFLFHYTQAIIPLLLTLPGKASPMSPLITA